jgi:Pumilio-family RNA binding repeat
MNYRRLLDKSVSCDWKYIVDKIVCSNDQQASIFLQQKLKVGTAEQKFEIVEAIVNQAYPLMINRFGNFLVQRCFEHGTPEQVVAIANAIHGNVLSLSMDAFGCHVIQKAFDSVPENHKADMVRELLRRIPDTVIHRYACHVWQKLFELRWSGEPPQIMVKVNEALRGMWHEVALGETGSLVVQNIFENCVEEEKVRFQLNRLRDGTDPFHLSVLPSRKSLQASTLSLMVSLATGASSTWPSMLLHLTNAVSSITFLPMHTATVSINSRPRLWRNA